MKQVLICQHDECKRPVYVYLRPITSDIQEMAWACLDGHEQHGEPSYAEWEEIDQCLPASPCSWTAHFLLRDRAEDEVYRFASEIGLDDDGLEESDWQPFTGDVQPDLAYVDWEESWTHALYHVIMRARGMYFFWLGFDDREHAVAWWQKDQGETRNGRVLVGRNNTGAIISIMTGTRPGGLAGSLASARSDLELNPTLNRVEIHRYQGPASTYQSKPLAVLTREDLGEAEHVLMQKSVKLSPLSEHCITTSVDQVLQQAGLTYIRLDPASIQNPSWQQALDPEATYYEVTLPQETATRFVSEEAWKLETTLEHRLPDGRRLIERRTYLPDQERTYSHSVFLPLIRWQHEGVIQPDPTGYSPGRFQLQYYNAQADQPEIHWLATGQEVEIEIDGWMVAGKIEHQLPGGYFFQPIEQAEKPSFSLSEAVGRAARVTVWEEGESDPEEWE